MSNNIISFSETKKDAEFWIQAFQECLHKQKALLDKECFRITGKHLEEYEFK